jgi:hypothetical protein
MGGTGHKVMFAPADACVGGKNAEGYWKVKHEDKNYACHRIVCELVYGDCTGFEIDHVDGDKGNNAASNLRRVLKVVNRRNVPKHKSNTTGVTGVHLRIPKHKGMEYPVWTAQWVDLQGVKRNKTFTINKYGEEEAFRLAVKCRAEAIEALNKAGAGYTERHGT